MRVMVVGRFSSIHTRRFAEELSRQGADVAALCMGRSADRPRLRCYQPLATPRILGLPKTARVASLMYLWGAMREFDPHIIHVQDDPRMAKWLRLTRPRRAKLAYTTWGHYPQEILGDSAFQRSLRDASLVVSDAQDVLEEIVPFAPTARQQIMRFGADLNDFSPGTPSLAVLQEYGLKPDGRYLLSPRSLRPSYNQLTLIRALPQVVKKFPDLQVILKHHHVENYEDAASYESLVRCEAERLGVWNRIIRLDHLPYEHLCHLYRVSRVAVSIPLMDGFPASIFESMASGCPLIVSRDKSYEGVIQGEVNSVVVDPEDHTALAGALLKIMTDDTYYGRLRENGFQTVRDKGDFTKEVAGIMRTYAGLLNGTRN